MSDGIKQDVFIMSRMGKCVNDIKRNVLVVQDVINILKKNNCCILVTHYTRYRAIVL